MEQKSSETPDVNASVFSHAVKTKYVYLDNTREEKKNRNENKLVLDFT